MLYYIFDLKFNSTIWLKMLYFFDKKFTYF